MCKRCIKILIPASIILILFPAALSCTTPKQVEPEPPRLPTSRINSISPESPYAGTEVIFDGTGDSSGSRITIYRWRSSLDGDLSDKASFKTDTLTEGRHKIFFSVKDDKGEWSAEATASLTVRSRVPPPQIAYFMATPDRIGLLARSVLTWHVDGAETVIISPDIGVVGQDGKYTVAPRISTPYTLTAINEGGSVSSIADVIVVPINIVGLPVINSFYAEPGSISPGSSANLSWNVTNADFVLIDPGVGTFPPSGSVKVTPPQTTRYTITAQNLTGMVVSGAQLIVQQGSGGNADLVISDIYKVSTPSGMKIGYTIENRGSQTAPLSNTRLYTNGVSRALDSVSPLPAGARQERQFNTWNYNPATPIVKVTANADLTISENNTANNEMQTIFTVTNLYDFKENAARAKWRNDTREVYYGGSENDDEGAALIQTKARLEDASGPGRYLETRPRATYGGWIIGDFNAGLTVRPGDHFYSIVGLLEGSAEGNVEFQVYISAGDGNWQSLGDSITDYFDYKLKTLILPVPPHYYGKQVGFSLRVNNVAGPLQNKAVWVEAKIIR